MSTLLELSLYIILTSYVHQTKYQLSFAHPCKAIFHWLIQGLVPPQCLHFSLQIATSCARVRRLVLLSHSASDPIGSSQRITCTSYPPDFLQCRAATPLIDSSHPSPYPWWSLAHGFCDLLLLQSKQEKPSSLQSTET